jgi:hypothetical protein
LLVKNYQPLASLRLLDIARSSAHFEQIINDIVCFVCLIEVFFNLIFYKDNNKYPKKQEKFKIFFFLK